MQVFHRNFHNKSGDSKALNTYRYYPILIQVNILNEVRGYQTGTAQCCLRAQPCRLCTHQAPTPGTTAPSQPQRSWRYGRAPCLFLSTEGLSSLTRPAALIPTILLPYTTIHHGGLRPAGGREGLLREKEQI